MFFRKRVLTDSELIPVVTDLIANIGRLHAFDQRLSFVEGYFGLDEKHLDDAARPIEGEELRALEAERKRADEAERALYRLRNRRSVKVALALARPFRGLFQTVRSWKKRRSPGS